MADVFQRNGARPATTPGRRLKQAFPGLSWKKFRKELVAELKPYIRLESRYLN